jgi:hypothetical protein
MAIKRITFRLYPNQAQNNKLHYGRKLHCSLYNACVYHRKTQYKRFGKNVNYFDQQNCLPDYARGLERVSLDAESSSSTLCGSMRQLGARKRQKR